METAGLFASSDIKPISAVGEMMGSMEHHIDGVHSLTGKVSDYASKAHSAVESVEQAAGGSLRGAVKTVANVSRKALRTGATIAESTALPAMALGAATANPAILAYGEYAPIVSTAARVAAQSLGQMTKRL